MSYLECKRWSCLEPWELSVWLNFSLGYLQCPEVPPRRTSTSLKRWDCCRRCFRKSFGLSSSSASLRLLPCEERTCRSWQRFWRETRSPRSARRCRDRLLKSGWCCRRYCRAGPLSGWRWTLFCRAESEGSLRIRPVYNKFQKTFIKNPRKLIII